jgi:dihydroorotate dehydrogenase
LNHWHKLGFGFVEVGTITYHPQPGNPKPRMFRLPEDNALINRLGFNNQGAEVAATRIRAARSPVPFGINLGKSKVTPLEEAARDYEQSYRLLHELGSYFVVNVSSPNTPGLRSLQEKGALVEILAKLKEADASRPLFVKIAPDLETHAIDEVIEVAHEQKLTGLIATNTTISRDAIPEERREQARALEGGLSGAPLKQRSDEVLRYLHGACDKNMILIGVGGIFTGRDLYDKIAAGAHLAQIYTGFVYGGPNTCWRVLSEFLELLERKSLEEIRGSGSRTPSRGG